MTRIIKGKEVPDYPKYPKERTWPTLEELIKAQKYIEIKVDDPELLPGRRLQYTIPVSRLPEAVPKLEDMHERRFGSAEGLRYISATKYQMKQLNPEEILDELWEINPSMYIEYWEPDITTTQLLRKFKKHDPEYFNFIAYHTHKIITYDLT